MGGKHDPDHNRRRKERTEDGEMLYCWQIFQEVPRAFLGQIIIRYHTKILSLFFFYLFFIIIFSPFLPVGCCSADSPPPAPPGSSWHSFSIWGQSFLLNGFSMQRLGGGKREKRKTRRDKIRSYKARGCVQQDVPTRPLCCTASSCLLCGSAAETSSPFFFSLSLWALLISSNVLQVWNLHPTKAKIPLFPLWKLICRSISNCLSRTDVCGGHSGPVQMFGLNWYFFHYCSILLQGVNCSRDLNHC